MSIAAIDQGRDGTALANVQEPGWRGSVQTKGQFSISSWWRFGWDITAESDESFRRFYQLDPILQTDRVNTIYLQGMSDRNYFAAKLYQFGGSAADRHALFQRLGASRHRLQLHPGRTGARRRAELQRPCPLDDAQRQHRHQPRGRRGQLAAQDDRSDRPGVDPFAHVRGDVFNYSDARDPVTLAPLPSDTVLRGVAATGMLYSYPFVAHTAFASHVFAPTAQIIVRQNTADQRRLPDEDAKSLIFDDTLLFDIDKFSGYDRFETGTARQRRHAVHAASQQRRLCPVRVRPELPSGRREPVCRSGPRPDRQVLLFADERARHQPLGLCHRPLSIADRRLEPHHARPASTSKD